MKRAILVAMSVLLLAAIGCDKDNDTNTPPPTGGDTTGTDTTDTTDEVDPDVEMISAAKWNIDSIGFDTNDDGMMDTTLNLRDCEIDNTLSFSVDSTGVYDEEELKCAEGDPQTVNFNWNFRNNGEGILIDGDLPGELEGEIDLVTFNDSILIMSKPLALVPGTSLIVALKNR